MSISNITSYNPIILVQQIHQLPHLNVHLHLESTTFDVSTSSFWNSYTKSIVTLPVIIFALFTFITLVVLLLFCCDCCYCKGSLCLLSFWKSRTTSKSEHELSSSNVISLTTNLTTKSSEEVATPSIKTLVMAFLIFFVLTILCNQTVFFGNRYLSTGINDVVNSVGFVQDSVDSLNTYGNDLTLVDNNIENLVTLCTPTCEAITGINSYLPQLSDDISLYNSYISPLPDSVSNALNKLQLYGINYKNDSLWVIYGIITLLIILYIPSVRRKSSCLIQSTIITNCIIMILIFLIGTVLMVILMVLSDFCMSPFDNLLFLIDSQTTYNITSYYINCQGINPISEPLDSAKEASIALNEYISELLDTTCQNNQYLIQIQGNATLLNSYVNSIYNVSSCPPIQNQVYSTLADGICDHSFTGFYVLWLWIDITMVCFLGATIIINVINSYFGRYWNIDRNVKNNDIFSYDGNEASLNIDADVENELTSPKYLIPDVSMSSSFEADGYRVGERKKSRSRLHSNEI